MRTSYGFKLGLLSALIIIFSYTTRANSTRSHSDFLSFSARSDTLPNYGFSDQIEKAVNDAIRSIDWDQIRDQIAGYMRDINDQWNCYYNGFDQIEEEINRALKNLDVDEIRKETQRAMQHGATDFDLTDMIESAIENSLNLDNQDQEVDVEWSNEISCVENNDLNDSLESVRSEMEENGHVLNEILMKATIK